MRDNSAIQAEGLVKTFGATRALDGLDLAVPAGGILGMLGPNGAGKTTAVRVFATLLRPDAGQARILGADVVTQAGEVRDRIGLTGQYAALDDYLTGRANLIMIGQLGRALTRRQARTRADELLERFDLTDAAGRAVKTYSGGMRRRLDLAASLIGQPEVLFLDEPTTGLDPRSRSVMWDIIRELAADGTTLLLTTQYLDEADQLAGQIVVVDAGRVIAAGAPDELKVRAGDDLLVLVLVPGADLGAAEAVVKAYATGPVAADAASSRISAQVRRRDGITTEVVRALDAARVQVASVTVQRPSLDDVFLSLTGHRGPSAAAGPDDTTIQPVIFVLLFAYVFGSAIVIPGGGNYHEYLIGGMLAMGIAGTAPGTAVALVTDMSTGLIDRFRALPMSRWAVLAGRTIADLVTQALGALVVAGVGLAIGWRVHTGPVDVLAAFGLALLFGYAFTWAGACLGMVLRSPEAAQQLGFVLFLPLMFISNAFVPTQGMPGWLQAVANWNPFSALAAAARHLFGNPNPAASVPAWPMQHAELAVVLWSAALLLVFAPLAVRLYRRKSLS